MNHFSIIVLVLYLLVECFLTSSSAINYMLSASAINYMRAYRTNPLRILLIAEALNR